MSEALLLCTDLDRTLIPNGPAPESKGARQHFATLVARPEVCLVYVSGRDRSLVELAIREYDLPRPCFVIGDVGTTIYTTKDGDWRVWQSWRSSLALEWGVGCRDTLVELLADLSALRLQEESKQGEFKISFYVSQELEARSLLESVRRRVDEASLPVRLVFSRDEKGTGLLDLLPTRAGKQAAIEFLMQQRGFDVERTVFAGDSGNDVEVLTSRIRAVLVANAEEDVRHRVLEIASNRDALDSLYLARGGFFDMNGNYSAGILEGLAHFLPEVSAWLE